MNKLIAGSALICCGLLLAQKGSAQAGLVSGYCIQGAAQAKTSGLPSSNYLQGIVPLCTVQVYLAGTTNPAIIYKDLNNTPLGNPFTANPDGSWLFAASSTTLYDVVLSGGVAPNTYAAPKTLSGLGGAGGASYPGVTSDGANGLNVAGTVAAPKFNATYTPAPGSGLQAIITTAGVNSDIFLSCGTYTVAGLAMPNNNVRLHGVSSSCTTIQFTTSSGLLIAGANVEISGIAFSGATANYSIRLLSTGTGFKFHDNYVTGGGAAVGASSSSAAMSVQAPNQDIWINDNEFTGNGVVITGPPAGHGGYTLLIDGAAGGYVTNTHIVGNWFHDNISPDNVYGFDLGDGSEISGNSIDQGNECGGAALCNNPAGNGVGYAIMIYSEAYACATLSGQFTCNVLLTRTGNVVTAIMGGMLPSWPLHVGDPMFLETAQLGVHNTDFNGVFPLTAFGTGITGGAGYTTANGLATTGGTGSGATVNIIAVSGSISAITVANGGTGYTFGDKITVTQGGGSGGYAVVAKVTGGVVNAVANYGMTWGQVNATDDTDDHIPGDAGLSIPPLPNIKIQNNTVTNSSGACIYVQGASNNNIVGNILTHCDLQSQAGGHPQSAIGLNGVWGGTVSDNSIDGVGLTHGIGADNAYFTAITGNNISNIPLGFGVQLYDSWYLTVGTNTINNATRGGIGGDANPNPNCFGCAFPGNTIRMATNGSGYNFNGADTNNSITGGVIHAPSTGLSNSAIFLGANTSYIKVSGVTVGCQPDGQTGAATSTYGIRTNSGAHNNVIRDNTITGCSGPSGAGILDTGTDDVIDSNTVGGSGYGVLANAGTRQLISSNVLWDNSTPINVVGSTGSVTFCNQIAQGATPAACAAAFDFTLPKYTFGTNASTLEEMDLNTAAGHQRLYVFMSGGLARWSMSAESNAESGSDAGSPFAIRAYTDAGTTLDVPITIVRAAGGPETHTRPVTVPNLTDSALTNGNCVQAGSGGLLATIANPCLTSASGVAKVATVDLTAQAATINPTNLYTVPADGWYEVICYTVVTQAATVSSTLPACVSHWNDADTNTVGVVTLASGAGTGNTVGTTNLSTVGMGSSWVHAKAGSIITYNTLTYVSSGATPMQFALHAQVIH